MSVGKEATPTYAIIDSQSVKTTGKAEQKGFDGGKKVKGRKRHILVDTIGNLLGVVVHAANIHDTIRYSPMSRPNNHKIKIELG